jgi:hypothetical protein
MEKKLFGETESAIVEQEMYKLLRKSVDPLVELSFEDIKKLDLLIKAKKAIIEREDVQEPKDVTSAAQSLPKADLMQLAGDTEDWHHTSKSEDAE